MVCRIARIQWFNQESSKNLSLPDPSIIILRLPGVLRIKFTSKGYKWDIFPSTPLKINMEPKHYPTEKENHLLSTSIFGFKMLIFVGIGVSSLPLASDDFSQHVSVNRSGLQDSKCADSRVMVWVGILLLGLFVCVFWWSKDLSSLGGIQTPGSNIIFALEHFDDWKTIVSFWDGPFFSGELFVLGRVSYLGRWIVDLRNNLLMAWND